MITRICIAGLLAAGWLLSAAGMADAVTVQPCASEPYKVCRNHIAYACHNVKGYVGTKLICRRQCVRDLTGGFGPCP